MKTEQLITDNIDVWTTAIKKRSATGRGNNKKIELTGIKKLRELILELAVRGQLVPQDPNDEPASVLLEKIAAEKAQLIKDKKIKKTKALPEIRNSKKHFELRCGWKWVRLQEIINISSGDGLTSKQMNQNGKIPVYGGNGVTGFHDEQNVKKQTLVIGRVGFYCGSIHLTPIDAWITDNAFITTFSESNIYINYLYWLFKATNLSENDNATAQPVISGRKVYPIVVCLPPLNEQHRIVAKVDELMALCDQLEQQTEDSITAHQTLVESLLATLTNSANTEAFNENWARIAAHFDTLFTTEHSIDQLKQTILQLAVMGKLVPQNPNDLPAPQSGKWFVYVLECENGSYYKGFTQDIVKRWKQHATGKGADWTAKYPPKKLVHWESFNEKSDAIKREKELKSGYGRKWLTREIAAGRTRQAGEPASVLLEKIAAEKEQLIKDKKIKKQKPLPAITEDEKLFELPNGWEWSSLGNITIIRGGKRLPKGQRLTTTSTPYIYIRVSDMKHGTISDSDLHYISEDIRNQISSYIITKNDIYMTIVGATIGKCGLVPSKFDGMNLTENAARLVPYKGIDKTFLFKYLDGYFAQSQFFDKTKQVGVQKMALNRLASTKVPLPPIEEQHRIVKKVDELITLCDQLKANLNQAQTTQLHLADAIVKQAVN